LNLTTSTKTAIHLLLLLLLQLLTKLLSVNKCHTQYLYLYLYSCRLVKLLKVIVKNTWKLWKLQSKIKNKLRLLRVSYTPKVKVALAI